MEIKGKFLIFENSEELYFLIKNVKRKIMKEENIYPLTILYKYIDERGSGYSGEYYVKPTVEIKVYSFINGKLEELPIRNIDLTKSIFEYKNYDIIIDDYLTDTSSGNTIVLNKDVSKEVIKEILTQLGYNGDYWTVYDKNGYKLYILEL